MEKEKLPDLKGVMPKSELISLVFELGFTIAIPIVLLALGGRLVDKHFHTSPLFILVGVILSIVISSFLVYKKMIGYLQ